MTGTAIVMALESQRTGGLLQHDRRSTDVFGVERTDVQLKHPGTFFDEGPTVISQPLSHLQTTEDRRSMTCGVLDVALLTFSTGSRRCSLRGFLGSLDQGFCRDLRWIVPGES